MYSFVSALQPSICNNARHYTKREKEEWRSFHRRLASAARATCAAAVGTTTTTAFVGRLLWRGRPRARPVRPTVLVVARQLANGRRGKAGGRLLVVRRLRVVVTVHAFYCERWAALAMVPHKRFQLVGRHTVLLHEPRAVGFACDQLHEHTSFVVGLIQGVHAARGRGRRRRLVVWCGGWGVVVGGWWHWRVH